ncbi:reticulon-like protein B17-like [Trifolium pratense]|uniref:Reticulon-like protein n=1 Tax=Trifolium pratense TaxID=57577 RepID=A0A2K3MM02_TRIPR|nr:reticulon-like protein B17 [Trifolium pratense]PNX91853.1 reticulon-like protein B17-like [Trifolium pratense]
MDSSTSTPHHHHRSSERRTTTTSPSPLSLLRSPTNCLPLRELLLMSPPSSRKSKPRFDEELQESPGVRRRCKSRGAALSSPRNSSRRSRRRLEVEVREEKENVLVDEVGKLKKRRHKKDRHSLVPFQSPKAEEENGGDFDRIGMLITELIMWKDVSKSSFWFGFGSLCFLSSCFTKGFNFSIFSAISQLAILFLAVSFFSNSVCQQRGKAKPRGYVNLKEDDILSLAKLILPMLNFAISKAKELFSGEPSMTLKVAPLLLLGAEYGHFITIWRLSAIGFFVSFTVPKLYSCYSGQINQRAECLKLRLLDTWIACSYKKIVVASALITFWNLSSIKTRICTAFLLLVIFRYFRQNVTQQVEDGEAQAEDKEQQQALLAAEPEEEEPQQALLVVAEQQRKH